MLGHHLLVVTVALGRGARPHRIRHHNVYFAIPAPGLGQFKHLTIIDEELDVCVVL